MWKCHKCGKPVYFAERKQSLGYDWHPECLRCEECGKRLNPGQHAEHKGVPYCHIPCYGALFGPQLYGHGTRVESHTSFGKVENKPAYNNISRTHLESKLKIFNQYYDGKSGEIRCREVNGRLVLEGALRIHWGVSGVIHLKEDDDQRTLVTVRKRNSYRYSANHETEVIKNGVSPTLELKPPAENGDAQNLAGKCLTLPSKLELNKIEWNEIDQLLQVERQFEAGEKLYQTMPAALPPQQGAAAGDLTSPPVSPAAHSPSQSSPPPHPHPAEDTSLEEDISQSSGGDLTLLSPQDNYSKCFEDSLEMDAGGPPIDRSQSNPEALSESGGAGCGWNDSEADETRSEARGVRRRARVLRRNGPNRRRLRRRCSINGHFYNRETSFFTPPYGSQMSVWVTSLVSTSEVINLMLDKYKVDSTADFFALYVVRDNGEQRMLREDEYPLVCRILLGPHEDVARLYLMDRQTTVEISSEVAQFLNLSLVECTAILERYNSEQRREEKKIGNKYRELRRRIKERMDELKVRL